MNWLSILGVALVAIGLIGSCIGIPIAVLLFRYDERFGRDVTRVVELTLFLCAGLGTTFVAFASETFRDEKFFYSVFGVIASLVCLVALINAIGIVKEKWQESTTVADAPSEPQAAVQVSREELESTILNLATALDSSVRGEPVRNQQQIFDDAERVTASWPTPFTRGSSAKRTITP